CATASESAGRFPPPSFPWVARAATSRRLCRSSPLVEGGNRPRGVGRIRNRGYPSPGRAASGRRRGPRTPGSTMKQPRRLFASLSFLVLLGSEARAQLDPNTRGVTWPAGAPRPLPDLDIRLSDDGRPAPWVNERNAELRSPTSLALRDADVRSLRSRIPLLRIDPDEVFGTPKWIASTARSLTDAREGDAAAVAREFVAAHRGLLEIAPEELDLARRSRDFETAHNGIRHLTFQQQIGGIDLFGAELRANVSRRGELINLSSTMLPRPEGDFVRSPVVLAPLQAIRLAAGSIGARVTVDPAPVGASSGASRLQTWSATPDFRRDTAVTTEFLYFPMTREDIRSAWKVLLPEIGI